MFGVYAVVVTRTEIVLLLILVTFILNLVIFCVFIYKYFFDVTKYTLFNWNDQIFVFFDNIFNIKGIFFRMFF
jgi:hypothetical protein